MMQKLKNLLIKKLGGYTKMEYGCKHFIEPAVMVENLEYITLGATVQIDPMVPYRAFEEDLKQRAKIRLCNELIPLMEATLDTEASPIIARAKLSVVKKRKENAK